MDNTYTSLVPQIIRIPHIGTTDNTYTSLVPRIICIPHWYPNTSYIIIITFLDHLIVFILVLDTCTNHLCKINGFNLPHAHVHLIKNLLYIIYAPCLIMTLLVYHYTLIQFVDNLYLSINDSEE